jgi:hypothetical protein
MLDFVTMVWDDLLAFLTRRATPATPGGEEGAGDDGADVPRTPVSGPPSLSAAAEPEAEIEGVELASSVPDANPERDQ